MNDQNKTKEELIKELQELKKDYNSLKALYDKDITEHKEIEDAMRKSQENYSSLYQNAHVGIYRTKIDGSKILEINNTTCEMLGFSKEEMLSQPYAIRWAEPNRRNEILKILKEHGVANNFDADILKKDGSKISCLLSMMIYKDEGYIEGFIVNINERKRAEDAVRQSRKELDLLFEASPEMISFIGFDGYFKRLNPAWAKTLGYPMDKLLSIPFIEFVHPDDREATNAEAAKLAEGHRTIRFDNRYRCNDGSYRWLSWSVIPDTKKKQLYAVARDITEHKISEDKLHFQSEIMNNMTEAVYLIRMKDDVIVYTNAQFEEMFGYSQNEMLGKNVSIVNAPTEKVPETTSREIMSVLAEKGVWEGEVNNIRKDRTTFWCYAKVSVFEHSQFGRVLISVHRDITERKQVEEKLREQSDAMEAAIDGLAILDTDQNYIYMNKSHAGIYGYDYASELIGASWRVLYDTEELQRFDQEILPELNQKGHYQGMTRGKKKDGSVFHQALSLTALVNGGVICTVRDITEHNRAEEAQRESELRINFHVNNSPLATIEWNTDFVVTRWAGEAEKIFGWNQSETIGKPIMDFPIIYDEDIPIVQKTMERLSDGSSKQVVSANRNYTKSGKVIYCEWYNSIFLNPQGKMISVMSQVMDITERKQAEETLDQERVLLRTIIDNFPNSIFVKDKKYRKIVVNLEHARRVTAHQSPAIPFSVDDLLGKTDFEVYPRELAEEFLIEDQKVIEGGQSVLNQELLSIDTNGRIHWELISKIPLWDRNGEIIGLVGISTDITGRKLVEQALIQSEENFHRSISESFLGIRIISIEGETIYVNKAFLDIYGYNSLEKFRSIPTINRYTPESYVQHQIRKEKIKNGHDIYDYEVSIVRENAEVRYVKVWKKEVLWNGVKHYQAFNLDITEQKQSEEALNNSQQELRKFATHLQNVREEEKLSLAREIHDDLGQILVALKMDLGMFKKKISRGNENINSEEILSKFDDFSNLVDNTIKSARRIMNGLRPELIELLGFEEACKSFLRDFDETHHIKSRFESAIMNLNISLEQSVALFRILQEALTNVAKHAKATLVTVQLSNPAGKLVMVIVDNGVGFDENNKGRQDSYGMIGMKERVFLLEGELNITSKVGKGTSVRVEMPYIS